MTDVMAALSLIADSEAEERANAGRFLPAMEGDQLVLDKWFTVQAVSKRQDTLEQVEQLTRHPDFSITNPNRVRSLVGAFVPPIPYAFTGRTVPGTVSSLTGCWNWMD